MEEGFDPAALVLAPDDPILAEVQDTLKVQLRQELDSLNETLRTISNRKRQVKEERDAIGVEMYNGQIQLSAIQTTAARLMEENQQKEFEYQQAKTKVQQTEARVAEMEAEVREREALVDTQRQEVDNLTQVLHDLNKYNEEVSSGVAVQRRVAYRAEEDMNALEDAKLEQDLLIANRQSELKSIQEKVATRRAQLEAQRAETKAARDLVDSTTEELSRGQLDNKQLSVRWEQSLQGISRRNEVLHKLLDDGTRASDDNLSRQSEIRGLQNGIENAKDRVVRFTAEMNRHIATISAEEAQIEQVEQRIQALTMQFGDVKSMISDTERSIEKQRKQTRAERDKVHSEIRATEALNKELKALEEEINIAFSNNTSVSRDAQNLAASIETTKRAIESKDLELAKTENELARTMLDDQTTQRAVEALDATLKELMMEVKDREELVGKYQLRVRRNNDAIEKKSKELDLLNRELERMKTTRDDVHTGPLESKIVNLTRDVRKLQAESQALQQRWLQSQRTLVDTLNKAETARNDLQNSYKQEIVLVSQSDRLKEEVDEITVATTRAGRGIEDLNRALERISIRIAECKRIVEEKQSKLILDGKEFDATLLEKTEETELLAVKLEEVQQARKDIIQKITQSLQQIKSLERKIQIERETQKSLDPETGQDNIRAMKKEIHRMELRKKSLETRQRELIDAMKQQVGRRQMIASKGQAAILSRKKLTSRSATIGRQRQTRAEVRGEIATLQNEYQRLLREQERLDDDLQAESGTMTEVDSEIREHIEVCAQLRARLTEITAQAEQMRDERDQIRPSYY